MQNMDDLLNNINKYAKLVEGKFLIDEIKSITKYIKETDADLKSDHGKCVKELQRHFWRDKQTLASRD